MGEALLNFLQQEEDFTKELLSIVEKRADTPLHQRVAYNAILETIQKVREFMTEWHNNNCGLGI